MGYGPRARAKIRNLHDWIEATGGGYELVSADEEAPPFGRAEIVAAMRRMPISARLHALQDACKDDLAGAYQHSRKTDGRKGPLSKWRRTMTRLEDLAEEIKAMSDAEGPEHGDS